MKVFSVPGEEGETLSLEKWYPQGSWDRLRMAMLTPKPPAGYEDCLFAYLRSSTATSVFFELPVYPPGQEKAIAFLQLSARKVKKFYKECSCHQGK